VVDGFRLDRGFQVLLTAYPEIEKALDLAALEPQAFAPGALVRFRGRFHRVADPFRQPAAAWRTLLGPIGSLGDKLRVAALRRRCRAGTEESQLRVPDESTAAALENWGFGPAMIERFFRPFLGGIFLERDLATTVRMFRFVFRMFATGDAVVPRLGMEEIPRQLAAHLPQGCVRLGARVTAWHPGTVVLDSGEVLTGRRIVVATDGATAASLVPTVAEPEWCGVTCLYFAAPRSPIAEPILVLNSEGVGPINNLCFPTQVAPEYGPRDETLVSVSVVDEDSGVAQDTPETGPNLAALLATVREQLAAWFGAEAASWRHLRSYRIERSLPRQRPGWLDPPERPARVGEGLYVAGDHLDTASSNGALAAGRRAAEAVLADRAAADEAAVP
jgi:hypothetical protein